MWGQWWWCLFFLFAFVFIFKSDILRVNCRETYFETGWRLVRGWDEEHWAHTISILCDGSVCDLGNTFKFRWLRRLSQLVFSAPAKLHFIQWLRGSRGPLASLLGMCMLSCTLLRLPDHWGYLKAFGDPLRLSHYPHFRVLFLSCLSVDFYT